MSGRPYRPIDCGLHDILLDRATRRVVEAIRHRAVDGSHATTTDRIVDVYTEDGAECLRTAGGVVVRLDDLRGVGDVEFPAAG